MFSDNLKLKLAHPKILIVLQLRQENKKLKLEVASLLDSANTPNTDVNVETGEAKSDPSHAKSGPSSALEFVTSPDDETINRLTAQLELIEKQRRQVTMLKNKPFYILIVFLEPASEISEGLYLRTESCTIFCGAVKWLFARQAIIEFFFFNLLR